MKNINLIKLILRAYLIFLFMYFMLNTGNNEQNGPNLHFDFALSPWPAGLQMLIQSCVSRGIKTQKEILILKNV